MSRTTTFAMLPDWVLYAEIDPGALKVFAILQRRANRGRSDCPGFEELTRCTGYSERQLRRFLRQLADLGAIQSQRLGQGRPNRYRIVFDDPRAIPVAPPDEDADEDSEPRSTSGLEPRSTSGLDRPSTADPSVTEREVKPKTLVSVPSSRSSTAPHGPNHEPALRLTKLAFEQPKKPPGERGFSAAKKILESLLAAGHPEPLLERVIRSGRTIVWSMSGLTTAVAMFEAERPNRETSSDRARRLMADLGDE